MNKYTVTIELPSKEAFLNFIDHAGPGRMTVAIESEVQVHSATPMKAPRQLRGSKVNTTIVNALNEGPRTVKQLKEALEGAGMSPGSLSTGLATLQREGHVHRAGEGLYALTEMKDAAE